MTNAISTTKEGTRQWICLEKSIDRGIVTVLHTRQIHPQQQGKEFLRRQNRLACSFSDGNSRMPGHDVYHRLCISQERQSQSHIFFHAMT